MVNLTSIKWIIFVPQQPPYGELKTSYKLETNICYTYANKVKYPACIKNCSKSLKGKSTIEKSSRDLNVTGKPVVNVHMKRCSTSLTIKGLGI